MAIEYDYGHLYLHALSQSPIQALQSKTLNQVRFRTHHSRTLYLDASFQATLLGGEW